MAKRKYSSPVFLAVSPLIYLQDSEGGSGASGGTSYAGIQELIDTFEKDGGLTSEDLWNIGLDPNNVNDWVFVVDGLNLDDPGTYYLLEEYILDRWLG